MSTTKRRGTRKSQPPLLVRILDPITWLCTQDALWENVPAWLDTPCRLYLNWYLSQTMIVRMQQAEDEGVGYAETWLPPGTDPATVTKWFEQDVMAGPRAAFAAVDTILCFVFHCDAAEQATVRWNNVPLESALIGVWHGQRSDWWREGEAMIANIVPDDHAGLYLLTKRMNDLFRAAFSDSAFSDR